MSLSELTDPEAVRQAMAEFDRMGRAAFLQRYGFGKARDYLLRENGRSYDSKAIVRVAFRYQFPDRGPLKSADFTGGENTVQRKLEDLGFTVERIGEAWSRLEVERTVGGLPRHAGVGSSGKATAPATTSPRSTRTGRLATSRSRPRTGAQQSAGPPLTVSRSASAGSRFARWAREVAAAAASLRARAPTVFTHPSLRCWSNPHAL